MKSLMLHYRSYRKTLIWATAWGSVPWLLACVYIPIAAETELGNLSQPWGLFWWLLRIFGPLFFFTELLFSWDLTLVASHMHWPSHYGDWTLFSILNIGFWFLILSVLKLFVNWIRSRMETDRK